MSEVNEHIQFHLDSLRTFFVFWTNYNFQFYVIFPSQFANKPIGIKNDYEQVEASAGFHHPESERYLSLKQWPKMVYVIVLVTGEPPENPANRDD